MTCSTSSVKDSNYPDINQNLFTATKNGGGGGVIASNETPYIFPQKPFQKSVERVQCGSQIRAIDTEATALDFSQMNHGHSHQFYLTGDKVGRSL